MENNSVGDDPIYKEMIGYFGSAAVIANHFSIEVQAVYQWKLKVPDARVRELRLLRKISPEYTNDSNAA